MTTPDAAPYENYLTFWRNKKTGGYLIKNEKLREYATLSGPVIIGEDLYFFTTEYIITGRDIEAELDSIVRHFLSRSKSKTGLQGLKTAWTKLVRYFTPKDNVLTLFKWPGSFPSIRLGPKFNDFALIGPLPKSLGALQFSDLHVFRGFTWDTCPRRLRGTPWDSTMTRTAWGPDVHGTFDLDSTDTLVFPEQSRQIWRVVSDDYTPREASNSNPLKLQPGDGGAFVYSLVFAEYIFYGHVLEPIRTDGSALVMPAYQTYKDIVDMMEKEPGFPDALDWHAPLVKRAEPSWNPLPAVGDLIMGINSSFSSGSLAMGTSTSAVIATTLATIVSASANITK